MLSHQTHAVAKPAGIALALVTLLLTASTFLSGMTPDGPAGLQGHADVSSLLILVWVMGRVAYSNFTGDGATLRLAYFATLPVPRARLARGLLIVGLLDPSLLFLLAATCCLLPLGARDAGLTGIVVAMVGASLTTAFAGMLTTVVGGLLRPGSRRGRDAGTIVLALSVSAVAIVGSLIPSLVQSLAAGRSAGFVWLLRTLPTGWASDALAATPHGFGAALPLLGLVGACCGVASIWPMVLTRGLAQSITSRSGTVAHRFAFVASTARGAVIGKELRLWGRDPIRLTLILIAALVSIGTCVVPYVSRGTALLLPFAGVLFTLIAGAAASNLYATDGRALATQLMIPNTAVADVRGRQVAWLILVSPYAVTATVVLTIVSGQSWAWAWTLGPLAAILGAGSGMAPLASLIAPQPVTADGGLTPGWPIKLYAAILALTAASLPTLALLTLGAIKGAPAPLEVGIGVGAGLTTGVLLATWLPTLASRRLLAHPLRTLGAVTPT